MASSKALLWLLVRSPSWLMWLLARSPSWLMPLGMLVFAAHANASWTLVQADAPVTVIHGAGQYQTGGGQRFAADDMVETPAAGGAQVQDDAGNSVLLGPGTRAMLMRDGQMALLQGWVKLLHACSTPNCTAAVIETSSTRVESGEKTAAVIAAGAPNYRDADAVFCESGTANLLAIAVSGNGHGKAVPLRLSAQQFAVHATDNSTLSAVARPDPVFIATMPVNFRDAVRPLPMPKTVREASAARMQPVSYDDIADWLNSGLAVRTQAATNFSARFQARLSDTAFRSEIKQHLHTLPDWRPLIYPAPRGGALAGPYTYRLITTRP
jgi:hypothetical protein